MAGINHLYLIGVGVTKCGTSSLSQFLSNSPVVGYYSDKETYFFDYEYDRGFAHYESFFNFRPYAPIRLDITPGYYSSPDAMHRIAKFAAPKKILLTLRHPVERAFSHYVYHVAVTFAQGKLPRDFWPKGSISAPGETRYGFDENFYDLLAWNNLSLVVPYADIIQQCFSLFGRENVKVMIFESWRKSTTAQLNKMLSEFIGKDLGLEHLRDIPRDNPTFMPFYLVNHSGGKKSLRLVINETAHDLPDMTPEQIDLALRGSALWTDFLPADYAQRLHELYFEDDTKRVEDLLDIDLSAWRRFRDLHYPRKMPPASKMLNRVVPLPDRPLTG